MLNVLVLFGVVMAAGLVIQLSVDYLIENHSVALMLNKRK